MVEAYALYILETLMSSHNCMPLSNLWTCFTSRFPQNAEFLSIVGPDMGSFERYLKSHPLLFKVNNFVVTLTDNYDGEYDSSLKLASTDYKIKPRKHETIFEFNFEQEAIKYFQKILINEKEKWITIESLESHLDQASNKIRLAIGPTRDFPAFLNRHPLVFEIQGDLVGLKEEYKNACIQGKNPLNSSNTSSTTIENQPASANVTLRNKKLLFKKEKNSIVKPNPTPPSVGNRRTTIYCDGMADFMTLPQGNYSKNRPYSMAEYTPNAVILNQENMLTNNQSIQKKNSVIALSISEFKSISWLRSILLTKSLDGTMSTTKLMQNLVEASESIHGTIGTTQVELVEFISKHPLLFNFNENTRILSMKPINMIHLIIIEDRQTENETYSLTFKKGCVFCITKLWGIIDLGFHEHVFFDRSLFKNVTDLTKHFKTGEALYFNAVLAAKESRAKWRAIRVWKETDKVAAQLACRQNLGYTNYQNTENGLIVTGPSEWDTDSGYDNVVDEYLSQTRKSNYPIDPNTIHQDSDLFSLLFVETVNLPECLSAFSSIRLADPWEVSSIIAQGPESLAMLDGNKSKSPIEANKTDDRCSSIASSLSESEMNTMSGVPSLAQQDAQDYNGKLDEKMSTLSITSSGYASKSSKLLQPVKYQKDTTSVGNCAATQTVFTGDIMATQLFHEDTQPTPV